MGLVEWWKLRWDSWGLRVVILISLGLQILLIFLAPLRKRVSTARITVPIWGAYLLADYMAIFAVGLISYSQGCVTSGPYADPTLLAFWAPFLLLHLGGPDTITAFALEDNELWLRHFLGLGVQFWAVGYAFIESFPNHKLWIPTVLMLLAGLIKYSERTRALYLASSRVFQDSLLEDPNPGPNYAKFMDEYTSKNNAKLPTLIKIISEPSKSNKTTTEAEKGLSDLEVVQTAHKFYLTFRGLIAELIFSSAQRNESRDYFLKRTARDAFQIVEVELNFFYDILYTKAKVMQSKCLGYPPRAISFILTCAALVIFYLIERKKFDKFDIIVTYTLLVGAIALDLIALFMILYSDWTAVSLTDLERPNWFIKKLPNWFLKKLQCLLNVERTRWLGWFFPEKMMQIVRPRWSESLSQYNLINYCLHPRMEWWERIIDYFGLTILLDRTKYGNTEDFTSHLRDFIFEELKMKSELADDFETAKEIFSARGDWILQDEGHINLLDWISKVEFDESLIVWHIATDLCYYTNHSKDEDNDTKLNRELSKVFSDYLLYLLILQSPMLSPIAGIGKIRFRDTCAEAKKFFRGRQILEEDISFQKFFTSSKCFSCCFRKFSCCFSKCYFKGKKERDKNLQKACERILEVNTDVPPVTVKGDRSKSVLFDACRLVKELKELESNKQIWMIISKVWVELMSYAAGHCRVDTHAAHLSKGGQLLTLVWLLMAHLGLGDQFQIREGNARAKLIVSK
ncbi:hypothetical protein Vadar_000291 [Vaccinium darrowii]|uniref:Uncharacterized protein n=1 Tax=Vaccinium darrowii TaxID=229202 RepID=A0ACB7YK65_9ERIC|nr:hypothetical protein Vadar_000291 [Vaccinium darrowii]